MAEQPAYQSELPSERAHDYDAFLSYSRADAPVAEGIQKGLHRIGRKMGRLHALRVFRDKTDLAASPSLWDKIRGALDGSRYLVVVLSPNSAKSEWVNKEVDYWLTHRGRDNLVLVLADGTVVWDGTHGRFDPNTSTAALPALAEPDALGDEPIYIDVSEDNPWDADNAIFRDKITDIAAPIHGKTKYELASEDHKEQQRFRRFRRLAIAGLALLTVIAIAAASLAFTQRREAIAQRNDAVARSLVADAEAILKRVTAGGDDRALQQLVSAYRIAPDVARGGLLTGVQVTASTEKIIRTDQPVSSVAVAPDGDRIVAHNSGELTVRTLDPGTGAQLAELECQAVAGISSVALSADGKRLACSGYNGTVRVWDIGAGRPVGAPLEGLSSIAKTVAISPDGTRVAAEGGPDEHSVLVWDLSTGDPAARTLVGHTDAPKSIAFSPDGRRIATGGADKTILVWDAENGERIGEPIQEAGIVYSVAFSPDGARILSGHGDTIEYGGGSVRQWDAESGHPIGAPMTGHTEPVSTVAYSADGERIASGSWDKTVRLWSARSGEPLGGPLTGHEGWVAQVVFTQDGRRVVSGSRDTTIRIWDAENGGQLGSSTDLPYLVSTLSPDARLLIGATARRLPVLRALEHDGARQIGAGPLHHVDQLTTMAISPDNRRLAIGISKFDEHGAHAVQILDIADGRLLTEIPDAHGPEIVGLLFSPDGTQLASTGFGSPEVRLWDVETGAQVGSDLTGAKEGINAVAFSPSGTLLAAGGQDRLLRVWDTATGALVGEPMGPHQIDIKSVAFSPDGDRIAVGDDGSVRFWDARTHEPVGVPLTGHDTGVYSLAFTSDGQMLASGDNDGSVRIWNVRSARQIGAPLVAELQQIDQVGFRPDDRRLLAASRRGQFTNWPGPASWPDLLCDKLTTNMSREEWKRSVSPDIDYIPACPGLPITER